MSSLPPESFSAQYPHDVALARGRRFELRLMSKADRADVIAFGQPRGDVPSLTVDITNPRAIDRWIRTIEAGRAVTILAREDGGVVAFASLYRDEALWTRCAGELHTIVAHGCRGVGLRERMVAEIIVIAQALGLRKVTVPVAYGRRASIAAFERMGFRAEALLANYLMDPQGEIHDLIIMSCDVESAATTSLVLEEPERAASVRHEEPATATDPEPAAADAFAAAAVVCEEPAISADAEPSAADADVAAFIGAYAPVQMASAAADDKAPRVLRAAVAGAPPGRARFRRVPVFQAAALVAVVAAVVAGSFYAFGPRAGGNESQVLSASETAAREAGSMAESATFSGSHAGRGRIVVPAEAPAVALQVSLEANTVAGTWFWCFESSFGLSSEEHYCSATGVLNSQTGWLMTEGVVGIDPAWPDDGTYFVQMYCESVCAWRVSVQQRTDAQ